MSYKLEFKQSDMIEFWSENKNKYSILFEFFKIYASWTATRTPSEIFFSKTGNQVWYRRTKITPDEIDKIMFVYENSFEVKKNTVFLVSGPS